MKTMFLRFGILLLLLALSVGAVFAQESAASPNTFTFVLAIIGGGIFVAIILGFAMYAYDKNKNGNGNQESK